MAKKIRVVGIPTKEELDNLLDMAVIFDGDALVHLKDDYKAVKELVVGDEVLGWRGEYRKITDIYQPKYFNPPMVRFGVGVQISGQDRDRVTYLELGEQTKVGSRNYYPDYDIVATSKKVRDINLHTDRVEVCNNDEHGTKYQTGEILKLSQRLAHGLIPWLIGVDGLCIIINDIVVMGCDSERIRKFIRKENEHEKRIKREARNDAGEDNGLRKDTSLEDAYVGEDY